MHAAETSSPGWRGPPRFLYYYWAANIRALMYWMSAIDYSDTPKWLILENTSCRLYCTALLHNSPW